MDQASDFIRNLLTDAYADSWRWFNGLTREEWMIVLAFTSACGFLFMRGMGNRKEY
ncbi:hypothetical protein Mal64_26480 [Pseudobythopirellula maris]|uniref:Uncharacterized protein n=1 Tax=Pseudobythopirellula maris TaxID=2527991 RepID=A0A5C5ZL03_9BACT|nr:hypothetical protein [Pseudobythopirellula maris]TWT87113.1 hypothetical protein Mal64_26480 [Pseudobythopirellula maris]